MQHQASFKNKYMYVHVAETRTKTFIFVDMYFKKLAWMENKCVED